MKGACVTRQRRVRFFKAERAQKEDSTRCNVPEAKTTHTGSQEGNKRAKHNNVFFKANYYAPFPNHAAMLCRDARAEFKKHSRGELAFHLTSPHTLVEHTYINKYLYTLLGVGQETGRKKSTRSQPLISYDYINKQMELCQSVTSLSDSFR